jgi:hypothetical protein
VAWGDDRLRQTNVPAGLDAVTAISAGSLGFHSLALVVHEPTTLTVSRSHGTYGGTVTLQAKLMAGSTPVIDARVTFTLNGAPVCGGIGLQSCATTDDNGVAQLTFVSIAGFAAGNYRGAIQANFAGDDADLTSSGSGDLSVMRARLTVTANDKRMTYGSPVPAFDATFSGLVNGDTSSVLDGSTCGARDGGQPVTSASLPRTCDIYCNYSQPANYDVQVVPGAPEICGQVIIYAERW